MKILSRKERMIIAVLLVTSQTTGLFIGNYVHPIWALPAFAVSFFVCFLWLPYRTGEFSSNPGNGSNTDEVQY